MNGFYQFLIRVYVEPFEEFDRVDVCFLVSMHNGEDLLELLLSDVAREVFVLEVVVVVTEAQRDCWEWE